MVMYYTGTKYWIDIANNQIEKNSNIPNDFAQNWDIPQETVNHNFWFICQPPIDGWNGLTQETMIRNIENVQLQEADQSWFPQIEI
jgi:hypothetical protein